MDPPPENIDLVTPIREFENFVRISPYTLACTQNHNVSRETRQSNVPRETLRRSSIHRPDVPRETSITKTVVFAPCST
jgi:hypothetical protein